ncbi:4Fe-4S dicluster domain-containing protein [Thermodesulfobacteriota bacterium]
MAGIGSVAFAAGCNTDPEKTLYSLVQTPDDMVTGKALWYASTCRECPAGCGIIAKNREGRIIKIEGNPLHPINAGKLCMRGQAALQDIYHPDRITRPKIKENGKWRPIAFDRAESLLKQKISKAAMQGENRIRMITEVVGEHLENLFNTSLNQKKSTGPLVYEAFAYEPLKAAYETIFGIKGLPSYHMEQADFLVSFGADFIETWLSPVEYAAKFNTMRRIKAGKKALFSHVSSFQSLTAANADRWIRSRPGGEAAVLFGLLHTALTRKERKNLPVSFYSLLQKIAAPFTRERVLSASGILASQYDALAERLMTAQRPLVLGTTAGAGGKNAFYAEMGALLINYTLDPKLTLFDFTTRHRVEIAAKRAEVIDFFKKTTDDPAALLLINNSNPIFTLPPKSHVRRALENKATFVVCFSNFMTETAALSDMVYPVQLPLETWDAYSGKTGILSTLQPAMGKLTEAPSIGDLFLTCFTDKGRSAPNYKTYLMGRLMSTGVFKNKANWLCALQNGGHCKNSSPPQIRIPEPDEKQIFKKLDNIEKLLSVSEKNEAVFLATPSLRFYDGRGANKPWLCEIEDPLTKTAWQTTIQMHPDTMTANGLSQGDAALVRSGFGSIEAPVYETEGIHPSALAVSIGQGHQSYGRWAKQIGADPIRVLSSMIDPESGGPRFYVDGVIIQKTGRSVKLAHTDGGKFQHDRKIALAVHLSELKNSSPHQAKGYGMNDFPLTLPLAEGYDDKRDIYPPHDHDDYRWAMAVDLDRCVGCGACAVACYAENNIGIVGEKRIIEGREMAWLRIERYHDPKRMNNIIFLPMMCQHCDNAPCEAVCPVYAPHHSKEGLNNQVYNRCIGTRFCAQNCPYKVRRFNWHAWQWPKPLNLQLNPDVTVRSAGVMEKCSFCIQRIKTAHGIAKNENRKIKDDEITPACMQTCPTGAISFGNLMDPDSRVRQLAENPRAYQVMGYLNTKPAVFYLKKVIQDV